jgi:DNA-directed RNA polymerase alpha subunit
MKNNEKIHYRLVRQYIEPFVTDKFLNETTLRDRQKEIIVSVIRDEKSFREIGEAMGLTGERVRQLFESAIVRLQRDFDFAIEAIAKAEAFSEKELQYIQQIQFLKGELEKYEADPRLLDANIDIPIEELELSTRALNVIYQLLREKKIGISIDYFKDYYKVNTITTQHLTLFTAKELMKKRNCGKKSIVEISEALEKYGLKLKEE